MTFPPAPARQRPTKPFKGKVIVQIVFEAQDPNGDARVWYWPDEIQASIEDRIKEHPKEIFLMNGDTGFMHDSWVKDAKAKVSVVEDTEGVE